MRKATKPEIPVPRLFEIEDGVGIITLNRPRPQRSQQKEVLESLRSVVEEPAQTVPLRTLRSRARGPKRSWQVDIGEMAAMDPEGASSLLGVRSKRF